MGIPGSSGLGNWESESYTQAEDFVALPFFVVFFPAVRFFLERCIFEVSF